MRAGIIGGGMIGQGWARLLAAHGHQVRLYDVRPELCQGAATLAEACAGADVVLEAAPENEALKRDILESAGRAAPPGALIVSSSSSILPSRLQHGVVHPERVLVLHPLHPVDLLPVVEVVPGARTSPEAVRRAAVLLSALGKAPVVLKREVTGYVVNRLAAALWREAIDLVLQGVADPETVDLAASRGPCLGWAVQGPFLTYELAAPGGLGQFMDRLAPAFEAIWGDLQCWRRLPEGACEALQASVAASYGALYRPALEQTRDRLLADMLRPQMVNSKNNIDHEN